MTRVGGRARAALLSASVVLAGGTTGAMAQHGSKAADERGRVGSAERMEQARERSEAAAQPIAAEVKARVVTGTVMLIDREARSVVLRDVDTGEEFSVQIPANAENFDQLEAGDRMDVNILQPLELAPPKP